MLYREIIAFCSQIHIKHKNTVRGQNGELLNVKLVVHIVTTEIQMVNIQSVPRSKHAPSFIIANQLMLYREIFAVFSEIHTKHTNTLCGQNIELLNIKPFAIQSNHYYFWGKQIRDILQCHLNAKYTVPR